MSTPYVINSAELTSTLQQALNQFYEQPRAITTLARKSSAYRMSFLIEELTVALDDGTELDLIFKDLSWQSLTEKAKHEKPLFLYNPEREIQTYRHILADHKLGQAVCYGAIADAEQDRYWLFLENLAGLELYQVGEFDRWEKSAAWLAQIHTAFRTDVDQFATVVPLVHYDADYFRRWLVRAQAFVEAAPDASAEAHNQLLWLAERYEQVVDVLVSLPVTLIHGEFYASNILVEQSGADLRVSPVDWEMTGIGPGLLDLAALTVGNWTEEQQAAMAKAYFDALPADKHQFETFESLLETLAYCHLYTAIMWLGWTPEWAPPAQIGSNWLGEAVRLAEKLRL